MTTPERGAVYLWAFDTIIMIALFCFTGSWIAFWFGLLSLAMFYSFLEWEFERKNLREKEWSDEWVMWEIPTREEMIAKGIDPDKWYYIH